MGCSGLTGKNVISSQESFAFEEMLHKDNHIFLLKFNNLLSKNKLARFLLLIHRTNFYGKNLMTTGVDILFREMTSPPPKEPIRNTDQPRVGMDDAPSRYNSDKEVNDKKSFADHVDDAVAPKSDKPVYSHDVESNESSETATPIIGQPDQTSDQVATGKVSDDISQPVNKSNTDAPISTEKTTVDGQNLQQTTTTVQTVIDGEEATKEPNIVTSDNASSIAQVSADGVPATTSQTIAKASNENATSNPANATHNISGSATVAAATAKSSNNTDESKNVSSKEPVKTAINKTEQVVAPVTENLSNNVEQAIDDGIDAQQVAQSSKNSDTNSPAANTKATQSSGSEINAALDTTTNEQSTGNAPDATADKKINKPTANLEVQKTESNNQQSVDVQIANVGENSDILENKTPTETVAIESTRTVMAAPVPPQNNNGVRNESAVGKSNASKKTNKVGGVQANAAGQTQSSQPNTQQTNLLNSTKSDILLDLGATTPKSDPAPLQTQIPNGQSSLSNGAIMAAQEVNTQRLTASSFASMIKTDAPVNPKMVSDQITVAINRNIVNGQNNFSIRLHPAELGQVDIRLEFSADGKMNASMVVENERTLSMLQRDQGALTKALQDAGVDLSGKNMNFSLMKQSQENNKQQFANLNQSSQEDLTSEDMPQLNAMQEVSMGYSNQSVDISV